MTQHSTFREGLTLRRISHILSLGVLSFGLLWNAECRAQSASDSASVVLAAWDSMMGSAPYEHPAGRTSTICLSARHLPRASGQDSTALDGLLRSLRSAIENRPDLSVGESCQPEPAATYGIWIMTAAQEPAIVAHVSLPQFRADGTGEIHIGNVRAGRWARFVSCYLELKGSRWHVVQCETVMLS